MGAWEKYYKVRDPLMGTDESTHEGQVENWSVLSIQNELTMLGFVGHNHKNDGIYGGRTESDVRNFQRAHRLPGTGTVDPTTAKWLFHSRIRTFERDKDIPKCYLGGVIRHESGYDPGAIGYVDANDRGIAQINSIAHPDVSDDEAFDAAFSIEWTANRLKSIYDSLAGKCPDIAWICAIASHNSPTWGSQWCDAGTPPNATIETYVDSVLEGC